MKKWTVLNKINEDKRWQTLSQALTDAGTANEFVPFTESLDGFTDFSKLEEFHHVRLSNRIAEPLLKNLKVQSSWTTLLGVVDGMVKTSHGWWPLCALYESFGQLLIDLGQDLDMSASTFVAGAGSAARITIASFFKAGCKKFIVTGFDAEEAERALTDVRRRFFGMNIQFVPMDKIVLLPGECSVAVNCTPSVEENELLRELSYLNFLKRPGLLIDLTMGGQPSILVQEAKDAGVRVVNGFELAARTDVLWAQWAFQTALSREVYQKRLEETLV